MIALFLRALLDGTGLAGARVVAGRPVRFAGDQADDALGEARLRDAYGWRAWARSKSRSSPRPPATASPAR